MLAPYSRQVARTGMQFNWRAISGPALTAATALLAFLVDRHFVADPQSRAAVRLHRSPCRVRQRHRLRHGQRRHCGGGFRAVLPQPPRRARLRPVGPGAHAAAGGDRRRHRAHHRAPPAEMGRRLRVGARSIMPPPTACRPRSIRSTSASCCSMPIPAPNSSTAPSAIISSCPTSRPTASRRSSR